MPVTSSPDWFEKSEWDGNHLHNFTVSDTIRLSAKKCGRSFWMRFIRYEISFGSKS